MAKKFINKDALNIDSSKENKSDFKKSKSTDQEMLVRIFLQAAKTRRDVIERLEKDSKIKPTSAEIKSAVQQETLPYQLVSELSEYIQSYVIDELKDSKKFKDKVITVQNEKFLEASKDGKNIIENPNQTEANALKIGDEFIWKTGLEDIAEDVLYSEEEDRDFSNTYEFLVDLNAKVIQYKKEYNSKHSEITRGENDLVASLQYAKLAILDKTKKIEEDSMQEAIIKASTQTIRAIKALKLPSEASNIIGIRAMEDIGLFATDERTIEMNLQNFDEFIKNNPEYVKIYDILQMEFNFDGTRKSLKQIEKDEQLSLKDVETNDTIKKPEVRNRIKKQNLKGYAQVKFNEIVSQYTKGNIELLIEEYGEQYIYDITQDIIKYKTEDIRTQESTISSVKELMERNGKILTEQLSQETYDNFMDVVGNMSYEGQFLEEAIKLDNSEQKTNMDIIYYLNDELAKRIEAKEEERKAKEAEEQERLAKEAEEKEEEKAKEKEEKEKEKNGRRNTNVFININKPKTDNRTYNTTNNTTNVEPEKDKNQDQDEPIYYDPEPKYIEGPAGKDGRDGEDGRDGYDGDDGNDGNDGYNGDDGNNGNDGNNGSDGNDGKNGANGRNGDDEKEYNQEPEDDQIEEDELNNEIDDLKTKIDELKDTIDELKNKPDFSTSVEIGINQIKNLYKQILEKVDNPEVITDLQKTIEDLRNKIEETQKNKEIPAEQEPEIGDETEKEPGNEIEEPQENIEEEPSDYEEPILIEDPIIPDEDESVVEPDKEEKAQETANSEQPSVTNNTTVTINVTNNITPKEEKQPTTIEEKDVNKEKITELVNQLSSMHDASRKMAIEALDKERVRQTKEAEEKYNTMYQQGLLNLETAKKLLDAKIRIIDAEMGVGMEYLDKEMASAYEKIRVIASEGIVGEKTLGIELAEEYRKNLQSRSEYEEHSKKIESIAADGTYQELVKIETDKEKEDKNKEEQKNGQDIS